MVIPLMVSVPDVPLLITCPRRIYGALPTPVAPTVFAATLYQLIAGVVPVETVVTETG